MKSGFISIVGKPNVGKSTLLNRLVGAKLAAVSKKVQTTRRIIRGILNEPRGQVVFLDTPGFHKPKDLLGKSMVRETTKTFLEADLFYFLAEPAAAEEMDLLLLERLRAQTSAGKDQTDPQAVFCVINKVDQITKQELLPVIDFYQKQFAFQEFIPISALHGDQLDVLIQKTFEHLPEREPYFPADLTTDQTERFFAEEIIQEKIFRFTGEEIPYVTVVQIEDFKEEEKLVRISVTIFVEKDSQKGIVIGAGGQKLKQIGTAARKDLEELVGKQVFLQLWVKTLKNWKKDEHQLKRFGYG